MAPRDASDDGPDGEDAKARQQADSYLQLAYDELRAIARQLLRGERPSHTLQATALVHEAWMRLSASGASFRDEAVFRRLAVRTMRRALVDHARKRATSKRGAHVRVDLDVDEVVSEVGLRNPIDVLALDEALERIAADDDRLVRILEMRVFAGLSLREIAETLELSVSHAQRLVTTALERLRAELGEP